MIPNAGMFPTTVGNGFSDNIHLVDLGGGGVDCIRVVCVVSLFCQPVE